MAIPPPSGGRAPCAPPQLHPSSALRGQQISAQRLAGGHAAGLNMSNISVTGNRNGIRTRRRGLVAFGPTRTGKTTWARSLGNHIYTVGLISGEELMKAPTAEYAVFDDMRGGIKFFPAYKEWFGAQEYVTIKQQYLCS